MSDMALLSGDTRRLADRVAARRGELGLTHRDIQAAGGPSPATLSLIEGSGRDSLQVGIAGKLEKALRWTPGSVRAILAGREPTPLATAVALGTATESNSALPLRVQAARTDPVLALFEERRAGRSVKEVANLAGLSADRWREITAGVDLALPSELVRMAWAVGVRSGDIRRAGRPDVANEMQDTELSEKYGDKAAGELDSESMEVLEQIRAVIERQRDGLDEVDQEIVDQQAVGLAKSLAAFRRRRRDAS